MTLSKYFHPSKILFCTLWLAIYFQPRHTCAIAKIYFKTWQNERYCEPAEFILSQLNDKLFDTWLQFIKDDMFKEKKDNEYEVNKDQLFFYGNNGEPILEEQAQIQFLKQVANDNTSVVYVDCLIQHTKDNLRIAKAKGHTAIEKVLQGMMDIEENYGREVVFAEQAIESNKAKIKECGDKDKMYADKENFNKLIECYEHFIGQIFTHGVTSITGKLQDYKKLLEEPSNFTRNLRPIRLKVREKYKNEKKKPQLMKAAVEEELEKIRVKQEEFLKLEQNIKDFQGAINTLEKRKNDKIAEEQKNLIKAQAEVYALHKNNTTSQQPTNPPLPIRPRQQSTNTNLWTSYDEDLAYQLQYQEGFSGGEYMEDESQQFNYDITQQKIPSSDNIEPNTNSSYQPRPESYTDSTESSDMLYGIGIPVGVIGALSVILFSLGGKNKNAKKTKFSKNEG